LCTRHEPQQAAEILFLILPPNSTNDRLRIAALEHSIVGWNISISRARRAWCVDQLDRDRPSGAMCCAASMA